MKTMCATNVRKHVDTCVSEYAKETAKVTATTLWMLLLLSRWPTTAESNFIHYFLVSSSLTSVGGQCTVWDSSTNLSDHLPILMSIAHCL